VVGSLDKSPAFGDSVANTSRFALGRGRPSLISRCTCTSGSRGHQCSRNESGHEREALRDGAQSGAAGGPTKAVCMQVSFGETALAERTQATARRLAVPTVPAPSEDDPFAGTLANPDRTSDLLY